MKTIKIAIIATAILSTIQISNGANATFFYKSGPAGSYVASNKGTDKITNGQSGWVIFTPTLNGSTVNLLIVENNHNQTWNVIISAPKGDKSLTIGSYSANRFVLQDSKLAGFDWFGNGRGLNTSTSYFNILDFYINPKTKTVERLAFEAIQFEETWGSKNLNYNKDRCTYLSYSYNSDIKVNDSPSEALMAKVRN